MLRIAVINNGKSILPFSLKAVASVYEYDPVWKDGELCQNLYETGEVYRVDKLILDKQTYYLPEPGDEDIEKRLVRVIVCGKIDRSMEYALDTIGISVTGNVYGDIKNFPEYLKEDSYPKYKRRSACDRGTREFLDYIKITGYNKAEMEHGLSWYFYDLTTPERFYLLDKWILNSNDWDLFDQFIGLFRVKVPLKRAVRYAWHFIHHMAEASDFRGKDLYLVQAHDLDHFKLLCAHIDPECRKEFLGEALILAVKYRLILFCEYLMDLGADIGYINGKYISVKSLEDQMTDLTLLSYLEYYRKNGKRKEINPAVYFAYTEAGFVYSPVTGTKSSRRLEEIP